MNPGTNPYASLPTSGTDGLTKSPFSTMRKAEQVRQLFAGSAAASKPTGGKLPVKGENKGGVKQSSTEPSAMKGGP